MEIDVGTFRATGKPRISLYDLTLEQIVNLHAALRRTSLEPVLKEMLWQVIVELEEGA